MGADHQDEARVAVIRRGAIEPLPQLVTEARPRRADVGVAVVPVDPPRLQDALHVAVVPGAPDVVHDLAAAAAREQRAHGRRDLLEHLIPGHALPLPFAPLPGPLQRVEDALGVVDLVDGGRPLGAVAPPAGRMVRVPLHAPHRPGLLVDVGQQTAGGFAVEAGRRDDREVLLHAPGPGLGVVLDPVVPALGRRRGFERRHGHSFGQLRAVVGHGAPSGQRKRLAGADEALLEREQPRERQRGRERRNV